MAELLNQINNDFNKKSLIFYKGWFGKLHQVDIIITEKWRTINQYGERSVFNKYVIRFKDGRTKYVKEEKLIREE